MEYKDLTEKEKRLFDNIDKLLLTDEKVSYKSVRKIAILLLNKYGVIL